MDFQKFRPLFSALSYLCVYHPIACHGEVPDGALPQFIDSGAFQMEFFRQVVRPTLYPIDEKCLQDFPLLLIQHCEAPLHCFHPALGKAPGLLFSPQLVDGGDPPAFGRAGASLHRHRGGRRGTGAIGTAAQFTDLICKALQRGLALFMATQVIDRFSFLRCARYCPRYLVLPPRRS